MKKLGLVLVLAVGCGGASKPAPQQPTPEPVAQKPPAPTCEEVGGKLSTVIDTPDEKQPASIAALVTERCTVDQWSAEARECLGTAENVADTDGCTKLLTEPQRTAFAGLSGGAAAELTPVKEERRSRGGAVKKTPPKTADPCAGGE